MTSGEDTGFFTILGKGLTLSGMEEQIRDMPYII